jgi:TusA-related sulfurtransferase
VFWNFRFIRVRRFYNEGNRCPRIGLPGPVLHTKAALQEEKPGSVKVMVDNAASQQNVQRFLESQGFQTALEQKGTDYLVIGTCGLEPGEHAQLSAEQPSDLRRSWSCAPPTVWVLAMMNWA